jgi:toxin-antitoxin system PIN domain toxin
MKTTVDLPDDLIRAMKMKALHEGKKLKNAITETLRAGLAAEAKVKSVSASPVVVKDRKTGWPVIKGGRRAARGKELTSELISEILVNQEVEWLRGAENTWVGWIVAMLIDTNVWMASVIEAHGHHLAVRRWIDKQSGKGAMSFCRMTQHSVLRLLTTEHIMKLYGMPPMTNAAAWTLYDQLLNDPRVGFTEEPKGVEALWRRFCARPSVSPKLYMDSYLAAFAIASQLRVVTIDRGFQQFNDIDVITLTNEGMAS